jgi:hypothetical protein
MATLKERFKLWLRNAPGIPNRLMAAWLKRSGWVVFYLDPQALQNGCKASCWLQCC